jgi:hypothetical protein
MWANFGYQAYMTHIHVHPTAVVRGTSLPVVGIGNVGAGAVLFPQTAPQEPSVETQAQTDDEYGRENVPRFIDALLAFVEELRGTNAEEPRSWTSLCARRSAVSDPRNSGRAVGAGAA